MDQDIRFQLALNASAAAAATAYFAVPYRCTLRDVRPITQAAMASLASVSTVDIAVTETGSSTSLGTAAVTVTSSAIAAGTVGAYTGSTSSSNNNTVLAAGTALKFSLPAASASNQAIAMVLDFELDPYARSL